MASILDAIAAAAANLQKEQPKQQKSERKAQKSGATKAKTETKTKKTPPKTDTPKTKGGAKYVIPAGFKQAIENHLNGRKDMKDKLSKKDKSIDGCCDYIFDVMRRRAEKERKGSNVVGLYADPDEIFGLAVHYYDESEEALAEELKAN